MKNSVFKVAILAAAIMISSNEAKAQRGFQLGVEVSPQFSYLVNLDDFDSNLWEEKHAFNGGFGISSQLGFTENLGIGLNVLYSFQGDKYEWKNVERYKSLQYLKIPLMFTVSAPFGTSMMFVGKIGPQLSIMTDAKLFDKNNNTIKNDYTEAFTNVDFGGMISAGLAYRINDNVSVDAALRYDVGAVNAEDDDYSFNIHNPSDFDTPAPATSPRANTSNMTAGLTVGVRYTFL